MTRCQAGRSPPSASVRGLDASFTSLGEAYGHKDRYEPYSLQSLTAFPRRRLVKRHAFVQDLTPCLASKSTSISPTTNAIPSRQVTEERRSSAVATPQPVLTATKTQLET